MKSSCDSMILILFELILERYINLQNICTVVVVWDLTDISYSNIFQTLCFYHKIISKALLLCATKYG